MYVHAPTVAPGIRTLWRGGAVEDEETRRRREVRGRRDQFYENAASYCSGDAEQGLKGSDTILVMVNGYSAQRKGGGLELSMC